LDLWIGALRRAFDHAQALAAHRHGAAQRSSRPPNVIDKHVKPLAAQRFGLK
jgi:hypothetical protein